MPGRRRSRPHSGPIRTDRLYAPSRAAPPASPATTSTTAAGSTPRGNGRAASAAAASRRWETTKRWIDPKTVEAYAVELARLRGSVARLEAATAERMVELIDRVRRDILDQIVEAPPATAAALRAAQERLDASLQLWAADSQQVLGAAFGEAAELGEQLGVLPMLLGDEAGLPDSLVGFTLGQTVVSRELLAVAAQFSAGLIGGLSEEARKRVNAALAAHAVGATSFEELTRRIGHNLKDRSTFVTLAHRARAIAVTEVGRIQAIATQAAQDQLAKEVPGVRKRWLNAHLPGARPTHLEAEARYAPDGTVGPIPVEQAYTVGGHRAIYPRDPALPASETVHCHCVSVTVIDVEEAVAAPAADAPAEQQIAPLRPRRQPTAETDAPGAPTSVDTAEPAAAKTVPAADVTPDVQRPVRYRDDGTPSPAVPGDPPEWARPVAPHIQFDEPDWDGLVTRLREPGDGLMEAQFGIGRGAIKIGKGPKRVLTVEEIQEYLPWASPQTAERIRRSHLEGPAWPPTRPHASPISWNEIHKLFDEPQTRIGHTSGWRTLEETEEALRRAAGGELTDDARLFLERYAEWLEEREEAILEYVRRRTETIRRSAVNVQASPKATAGILRDRFKTQHEIRATGGGYDPQKRRMVEGQLFGYGPTTPAELRPVYGHVLPADVPPPARTSSYGPFRLVLDDEVRERTTFTFGDSLDRSSPIAHPLAEFDEYRLAAQHQLEEDLKFEPDVVRRMREGASYRELQEELWDRRWAMRGTGDVAEEYIEAQIHGGVAGTAVREVRTGTGFTGNLERVDQLPSLKDTELAIRRALEADIPVTLEVEPWILEEIATQPAGRALVEGWLDIVREAAEQAAAKTGKPLSDELQTLIEAGDAATYLGL